MNEKDAFHFLDEAKKYGSVLGLENMKNLLEGLDNPQSKLRFVHIAGTNGKGSTGAFISNMLAVSGYKVGRYSSPAVFSYEEIIQIYSLNELINTDKEQPVFSKCIDKEEIVYFIDRIKPVCEQLVKEGKNHPTVFEIETAMAFLYFGKEVCDVVVLEVGLGGRSDATNIISTTLCSVITSISMDHMQYLGNSLKEIAYEKAGIIKKECPVVSYMQQFEAEEVIKEVCMEERSPLKIADFKRIKILNQNLSESIFDYKDRENLTIKLLGENQILNAVTALETIDVLKEKGFEINEQSIRTGLLNTKWEGRFEVIHKDPLFVIDGAHNEGAAKVLSENIKLFLKTRNICFILGVFSDKDYRSILKHTAYLADTIYTITPNNNRALKSNDLAEVAKEYCKNVINAETVKNAVSQALNAKLKDKAIVAFGSLSFLKDVKDELKSIYS